MDDQEVAPAEALADGSAVTAAQQPGLDRAAEQYRMAAAGYDHRTRWLSRYRRRAVDQLRLAPGAVVIEAACGTGINFPLLQQRAGLFPQPGSSPALPRGSGIKSWSRQSGHRAACGGCSR